ncbi:hypothetical protein NEOLEDRAFT_1095249 [Neolentinus lepideus HHB14362 ss-1]|uniref:Shieldin complex subunit 2 first OB fold domain-containing protein n=1 Tax=Neolentinus lepideus HHB14362 ss-1 TaxID=1314782 RepID=A0A165RIX5_9AGAM|nr:hypothetical protein NEOLEDRAFT_1095249 [Neolentinus lepideus HHB14362 ss-1]
MPRYRVFVGAPSVQDIINIANSEGENTYEWQTVSSSSTASRTGSDLLLPPATLEAASRRVESFYGNIIFDDDDEEPDEEEQSQTTAISWPTTQVERTIDETTSLDRISMYTTRTHSFLETQENSYSDTSSIVRFPNFHFLLSSLSLLSNAKGKISVVVAVLEADGPDMITIKKGAETGKEVAILKMIVGDEHGTVAKLTSWREVAEAWGGVPVKRGDVVLLESKPDEDVNAGGEPMSLTASPNLKSRMEVCYRTMPYAHEDRKLRPDLRLGRSDPAVRKVAAVVHWFEAIAGLREEK